MWDQLASDQILENTAAALKANGIESYITDNAQAAKQKVLELLPEKSEVMTMTSTTLDSCGITAEVNDSEKYNSIRKKLMDMDPKKQKKEMNRLGAGPDYVLGSIHAVTEDGRILIASATGSQLPAYSYAAGQVIWVVGSQKIVKDLNDGIKRIYEYCLPLEDARAVKAYGVHSSVSKILIFNKEPVQSRIKIIFVKEKLGF